MRPTKPPPAAIYCRISRDRAGAGLGVERQEADCRALAERLGWNVVAVYVDNDVSAYSGKVRPQYREMVQAIERGAVRGIVAWHSDRLHRRTVELESFVSLVEKHHVQVQTVQSGEIDLSTASGRMIARILGATAQAEVEQTRARLRAQKAQAAQDGKYRGSQRPFGFEPDGVTHREDEARAIRDATKAILAGRSLSALVRELNERGIRTTRGREWINVRLRDVLIRPRNAGLIGKGRPDLGEVEVMGEAIWEPIVSPDEWRAIHALLVDPKRRTAFNNALTWFGAGLYRCGICGAGMRVIRHGGTPSNPSRVKTEHYRCRDSGHLTIKREDTDEYVMGIVAERLRDPRIVAAMTPADESVTEDRDRRAVLQARLETFEADYQEGNITGSQLAKVTAAVTAETEQIDERLAAALRRSASSPVLSSLDPGQAFFDAPVDVQVAVAKAVVAVEILPAADRGRVWSPQRVRITWVQGWKGAPNR